eukprot:XP_001708265.1 Hypothetical protein GL50803_10970 [Giardia lamblia ATCC 50803]
MRKLFKTDSFTSNNRKTYGQRVPGTHTPDGDMEVATPNTYI